MHHARVTTLPHAAEAWLYRPARRAPPGPCPDQAAAPSGRRSGGVASAPSAASASSSPTTDCAGLPSLRIATVPSSASRLPTTSSTGTCARLCSRTFALIFSLRRSTRTDSPAARAEIARSDKPGSVPAKRYGVSTKTVCK